MEDLIFCGIQASGKTSVYLERFFDTHVRLSLDMLRTRHRESRFLETCLATQQRFVVDNTNPTAAERRRYIAPARSARFRVLGYFFESSPRDAIARNESRKTAAPIPVTGILGTYKRLQVPELSEGFDELYRVRIAADGRFVLDPLSPAVSARAEAVEGDETTRGGDR